MNMFKYDYTYDKEQFADIGFYVGDNKAHDFVVDFNEGKLIDYV